MQRKETCHVTLHGMLRWHAQIIWDSLLFCKVIMNGHKAWEARCNTCCPRRYSFVMNQELGPLDFHSVTLICGGSRWTLCSCTHQYLHRWHEDVQSQYGRCRPPDSYSLHEGYLESFHFCPSPCLIHRDANQDLMYTRRSKAFLATSCFILKQSVVNNEGGCRSLCFLIC